MSERVFSYRILRGIVGAIALLLALVTAWFSGTLLDSVSAAYHTDGRDAFVGALFVTSAFLAAYQGHPLARHEFWMAKAAAGLCLAVAIFPTSDCPVAACTAPAYLGMDLLTTGMVHLLTAAGFFAILIGFLFSFAHRAWHLEARPCGALTYALCGAVMILAFVAYAIAKILNVDLRAYGPLFYAEHIALSAFGIGWIYSGLYHWARRRFSVSRCPQWLEDFHAAHTGPGTRLGTSP